MTPAELWKQAVSHIEIAQIAFLEDDQLGAQTAAQISLACSTALLARPPGRQTYGEYDHDETVADRQEVWADQTNDTGSAATSETPVIDAQNADYVRVLEVAARDVLAEISSQESAYVIQRSNAVQHLADLLGARLDGSLYLANPAQNDGSGADRD